MHDYLQYLYPGRVLLGTKLQLGGHNIKLVCRPATVAVLNKNGARVRLPTKGREEAIELDPRMLPGNLFAAGPAEVNPSDYDLVAWQCRRRITPLPKFKMLKQTDPRRLHAIATVTEAARRREIARSLAPGENP